MYVMKIEMTCLGASMLLFVVERACKHTCTFLFGYILIYSPHFRSWSVCPLLANYELCSFKRNNSIKYNRAYSYSIMNP